VPAEREVYFAITDSTEFRAPTMTAERRIVLAEVLAEGEELGSNILPVAHRSPAYWRVWRRGVKL
jgi:hypothetical protein